MSVLIIGSDVTADGITSIPWRDIPDDLNVTDYEAVLLDLSTVRELDEPSGMDSNNYVNGLSAIQFRELIMKTQAKVLIVGSPLEWMPIGDGLSRADSLLPGKPDWKMGTGKTIRVVTNDASFTRYLGAIVEWRWSIDCRKSTVGGNEPRTAGWAGQGEVGDLRVLPLAENAAGSIVAAHLVFKFGTSHGFAYWLPIAQDPTQGIRILVEDVFGISLEVPAPEWAGDYELPDEVPIREEITAVEDELAAAQARLDDAKRRLDQVQCFRALLYAQHTQLEIVVAQAFEVLGASLLPVKEGYEDIRFTDPAGGQYIVEVKGTTKGLKRQHLRQLRNWTDDAFAFEKWEGRGVLVLNAEIGVAPDQRSQQMATNEIQCAVRFEQAIITGQQLFEAICEHQRDRLDTDRFWAGLSSTCGIFKP